MELEAVQSYKATTYQVITIESTLAFTNMAYNIHLLLVRRYFVSTLGLARLASFLLEPSLFAWLQFDDRTNAHACEDIDTEQRSPKSKVTLEYTFPS
jgi:hypothetical protein